MQILCFFRAIGRLPVTSSSLCLRWRASSLTQVQGRIPRRLMVAAACRPWNDGHSRQRHRAKQRHEYCLLHQALEVATFHSQTAAENTLNGLLRFPGARNENAHALLLSI